MAKTSNENPSTIVMLLLIIFVAGGYLTAWLIKQKILFYQNIFWLSFWLLILFLAGMIFFFIWFLFKKDKENFYSFEGEFFDKKTIGWSSLICLAIAVLFFFIMINSYQRGFSDEAMKSLAEAEGKLTEFNYLKDALTGAEIERLLTENFDLVMQDICKDKTRNCQQIINNYQQVKEILVLKERADEIMTTMNLIDKAKKN